MGFLDSLFGNAKLGIQISNQVIKTLLKDKELFIYPVVMAFLSFILLVVIFVPFVLFGGFTLGPLAGVLALLIYYLVTTFMATYFLFAMYIAFTSFVQGKKMGMIQALGQASGYLPQIIGWTIFYSIILLIARIIEGAASNQRGIMGMVLNFIVTAAIQIGLFLGTTFAVPIIFEDKVGPIEAVKRSATFIINNIGKTFSGIIYFDVIAFVIKVVGVLFILAALFMGFVDVFLPTGVVVGGFTILGHSSLLAIAAVFLVGLAIYVIGMLFNYVTLHIYYLVLYDFVKSGKVPKGLDETLLRSSIKGGSVSSSGQGKKKTSGGGSSSDDGDNSGGNNQNKGVFGGLFQSSGGDDDAPDLKTFVK